MRVKLTLATALALALAGCSSEKTYTVGGEDGETGEFTIDTDSGESNFSIETEDGTMVMRSGSDVPVDLPGGFSVYPGAEVISNTTVNQANGSGSLVTLSSSDSPEEVAAFYKSQAEKAGIKIQMEMSTNGMKMIGGESEDGLTFSVMASPEGEGTSAQLTVGRGGD